MKKRLYTSLCALLLTFAAQMASAQGWPANYGGVMLQGFSWDSYTDTQWSTLESQADELSRYFKLIWVPQSGNCNTSYNNMGYMPVYYFDQNSSFGSEAQLRSMIQAFKQRGTGIVADVVINHRNNLGANGSWVDFPKETYNGVTYQMTSEDIPANDDGGQTKAWADENGYSLSANNDEGEDWSGCRDLDHKSQNVQECVKAYVKYLVDDLGYTGFRYDMVKGYDGSHVADYNQAAGVEYSVGEYLDSNEKIESWINATGKKSAAFDFQFRYNVRDAVNGNDWSKLNSDYNLMHDPAYRQYAVTFVENHDTQYRSASEPQDPLNNYILAANAYMLAMPGTPCVFLPHWKEYKQEIKNLIEARKLAGITNMSDYKNVLSHRMYLQNEVTGEHGKLLVYLGTQNQSVDKAQWVKLAGDNTYSYWLSRDTEVAWADKASGTYANAVEVTLSAISTSDNAQVVYTLDGSEPTANSTAVASGTKLPIDETCTLTYGLLKDGKVTGISSRQYTIEGFSPHTATIYLKDPNWTNVYFYAWDEEGDLLKAWPGTEITATKEIDDERWYYHTFDINEYGYTFNIIFNQGKDKMQTVDIGPLSEDTYFEIGEVAGGKYTVNNVSGGVTGIESVTADDNRSKDTHYYDLNGYKTDKPQKKGIYIHQGKKIVVR